MKLVNFEIEVLKLLLAEKFSQEELANIISTCEVKGYEFTGAGYYLKLECKTVCFSKATIYKPLVKGENAKIEVGFLLHLDNNNIIIECHSWSDKNPPVNIREHELQIISFTD